MYSHVLSNHLHEDLRELKRTVVQFLRHTDNGKVEGRDLPAKNVKDLLDIPQNLRF